VIAVLLLQLALPCVVAAGVDSRAMLQAAGITRVCAELSSREPLETPGIVARAGLASPTRSPWIVSNGWRVMRRPAAKYIYDVPAAKAALAAAEAFASGADAALKIDNGDVRPLGEMLAFLARVPPADRTPLADIAVVDDGSAITGEVMNLLARRNLLFEIVRSPSPRYRINIAVGSPEYPRQEASDPSAFAVKVRRQLTDEQRTLRVYGSEVVLCRLTGAAGKVRLHLINYGGRDVEGLRIRLRGAYRGQDAQVSGVGREPLQDLVVADGATEFSLPRLTTYAVVDLEAPR